MQTNWLSNKPEWLPKAENAQWDFLVFKNLSTMLERYIHIDISILWNFIAVYQINDNLLLITERLLYLESSDQLLIAVILKNKHQRQIKSCVVYISPLCKAPHFVSILTYF